MAEFSNKLIITYRWWNEDLDEINDNHQLELEESAMTRIIEQLSEGFTSGELHDNVRMYDTDPEDGIEYSGFWEKTEERG